MIIDKLSNADRYYGIHPNIELALKYLVEHEAALGDMEPGITQLTDDVRVKILEYNTMPYPRRWESHVVFTDIQYMIRGTERVGYSHIDRLSDPVPQEGKDQIIYQGDGEKVLVPEGHFVILFPQDAHMSKLYAADSAEPAKKAAFKIRL